MPITSIRDIAAAWGTTERLMTAGEQLFGERGFEGIALEEIARLAGQRNKYAVQYHFGGRDELAKAIFDLRAREVDRRRGILLEKLDPRNPRTFLEAFFMPIDEQVGLDGQRSYALFLQRLAERTVNPLAFVHPLADDGTSASARLFRRLCDSLAGLPADIVLARLTRLMIVPLNYIAKERGSDGDNPLVGSAGFSDVLRMVGAALAVPQL